MSSTVDRTVRVRLEALAQPYVRGTTTAAAATRGMQSQVATSTRRMGADLRAVGLASGAIGAALLMARRAAGDAAQAFESETTKMVTQIGLAKSEADALGQSALGLTDTTRGPQELAESLFFVTSAGMRGRQALDVVEASAKAAAIGLGETAQVADLVTSAVNAYGPEALSAAQATDVLVGTVREGKAAAPELSAALGQVLPVASEMGVRFDEVGAAVAAMTRTGTNAGTAAMQLRQILAGLLNPAQGVRDAMADFGLEADGVRRTIREDGLWQALMDLRQATGGNEEALGRLFPNVRSLAGFLDLTGANAEATAQIFESLTDTTGLLDEGFAAFAGTAEAADRRASAAWEAARIKIGDSTLAMRTDIKNLSATVAESIAGMEDATAQTVTTFAGAAGGVGLLGGAAALAGPKLAALLLPLLPLAPAIAAGAAAAGVAAIGYQRYAQRALEAAEVTERFLEASQQAERTGDTRPVTRTLAAALDMDDIMLMREFSVTLSDIDDAIRGGEGGRQRIIDQVAGHAEATGDGTVAMVRAQELLKVIVPLIDRLADEYADATDGSDAFTAALVDDALAAGDLAEALKMAASDTDALGAATVTEISAARNAEAAHRANADATSSAGSAARAAAGDVEELTSAQQFWADTLGGMSDPVSVYESLLADKGAAERESAEKAAEAAGESATAWEDFADDVTVSLSSYADALEEHLADTREFESNLLHIARTVGADVAMILADMGPTGIALAADMVDGTTEEVERLAGMLRAEVERGGDEYAVAFERAMAAVEAIGRRGGRATMAAFAEELGVGIVEAREIAERAGIVVDVSTVEAIKRIAAVSGRLADLEGTYRVRVTATVSGDSLNVPAVRVAPGGVVRALASGGPVRAGETALVGEEGPELVRFGESGHVFPADATSRMLAAGPVAVAGAPAGHGGVTVEEMHVQAWTDRFSLAQVEDELAMHGAL